jgi:hypothetical protein
MDTRQFRIIVLLYILLGITIGVSRHVFDTRMIPSDILERAEKADRTNMWIQEGTPQVFRIVVIMAIGATILTFMTGLFGMLFLWNIARYLYLIAMVAILCWEFASPWVVRSSVTTFLNEIDMLYNGVLVYVVFFGPAKIYFVRKYPKAILEHTQASTA